MIGKCVEVHSWRGCEHEHKHEHEHGSEGQWGESRVSSSTHTAIEGLDDCWRASNKEVEGSKERLIWLALVNMNIYGAENWKNLGLWWLCWPLALLVAKCAEFVCRAGLSELQLFSLCIC